MKLSTYLDALETKVISLVGVSDVRCNYVHDDQLARVHVRFAPWCVYGAVTVFVSSEEAEDFEQVENSRPYTHIWQTLNPSPKQIAASKAAMQELDELKAKGLI